MAEGRVTAITESGRATNAGGWGHAETSPEATAIVNGLPKAHPIAKK